MSSDWSSAADGREAMLMRTSASVSQVFLPLGKKREKGSCPKMLRLLNAQQIFVLHDRV